MRLPTTRIIHADVWNGLLELASNSVDLIVTSPPYWGQRNYKNNPGQIGHEATSQEFVDKMDYIFSIHCARVLKPHGLIFLNLGDSYNGSGGQGSQGGERTGVLTKNDSVYKPRDLVNIPHRVYEALRKRGYYWRSTIVWSKPNGMPESVQGVRWERHRIKVRDDISEGKGKQGQVGNPRYTGFNERYFEGKGAQFINCPGCDKCSKNDGLVLRWGSGRPTNKTEYIGVLTKENYYWDTEAVRTPYAQISIDRRQYPLGGFGSDNEDGNKLPKQEDGTELDFFFTGANLTNVWEMPTAMFGGEHFATFPTELPELCIKAGSSEYGCCSVCGKPYARILERTVGEEKNERYDDGTGYTDRRKPSDIFAQATSSILRTIGWRATCNHPDAEVVPSVVLDPFNGAGTTVLEANRLGRDGIGIDINQEYVDISEDRVDDDAPLFYFASKNPI